MSGILRLESLTKGNTLKQGDKTPLKYRLFDADGENLNIAGKSAQVRLVYPDFLTIGYEKDGLTVAQDDTVTFTIDSIIPSRIYHVEIIVDGQFIFPSRSDESKFTVDKSSLGTEANIIEIVGVDQIVNKVLGQVDADISQAVTDINATNEAIQQAEQERKQWFEDTQIILDNLATYENLSYAGDTESYIKDNEIIVTNLDTIQEEISVGLVPGEINIYYASGELQSNSNEDGVRTIGLNPNLSQNHSGDGKYMKYSFAITSNGSSNNRFRFLNSPRSGPVPDGTVKIRNTMLINLTQVFGAGREPSVELMDYLMSGLGYFSTHTLTLGDILRLVTNPSHEDIDTSSLVNEVLGHINPTINGLTARMDSLEIEGVDVIVKDKSISPRKTTFIEGGKNLFDKSNSLKNHYWARENNKMVLKPISTLDTHPEPIPVVAGQTYHKNNLGHLYFADGNLNAITWVNSVDPQRVFVVPENARYMFFNVPKEHVEIYQLEEGDKETAYDTGRLRLSSDIAIPIESVKLSDKYYKVHAQGDFEVLLPISESEYSSFRFQRDTYEDYMKMRENAIFVKSDSGFSKKFEITMNTSNKEFAFSVAQSGSTETEWFPQHNNLGTTFVTDKGTQAFYADGKEVNIETATTDFVPFSEGEFVQICFSKLPTDTDNRAKLIIKYEFDKVVKQYFEMEFLQASTINAGYVFQLPARQDFLGQIKTDKREVIPSQETEGTVHSPFSNLEAYEYYATSNFPDKKDYYMRHKITNHSHDLKSLELQHRASQFQKLYPKVFQQTDISEGEIVYFDGEYEIGKLKDANIIYG